MATTVEILTRAAVHKRDHHHPNGQHCTDPVECVSFGTTLWFAICHDCSAETPLVQHDDALTFSTQHRCDH